MYEFDTFIRLNLRFAKIAGVHLPSNFHLSIMNRDRIYVLGDVE